MRKWISLVFAFACVLGLVGCDNAETVGSGRPIAAYIGDYVTTVDIIHHVAGETTQWIAVDEEVDSLRTWVSGLKYELVEFEEGQSPGDSNGGEVYDFVLTEGGYPGFSYIVNGEDNCYLLIEGYWYFVTNPSNLPITESNNNTEPLGADSSENSGSTSSASVKPDDWTLDGPPELVVSTINNADSITASCGNYQWSEEMPDGTTSSFIACGAHPLDEIGERATLYTAFPAGNLPSLSEGENMSSILPMFYLNFGEIPPETVTVHRWPSEYIGRASEFADENEEVMVDISDGFTILPIGDGEFVYEVHAAWGEVGSADYVFNTLPQVRGEK